MPLALKTRDQFVADEVAAIQAFLPGYFQFQIGSIVRAIVEAHAGTAIWEESLVQFVLARTRLATSTGTYADTFVGDFGLKRLPAVPAGGNVTFTSFTATQQRTIQVGSLVSTQAPQPGIPTPVIGFSVQADTTNPYFNVPTNSYILPPSVTNITVPVLATIAGAQGNVASNTVIVINSPIVGIDIVTNANAFTTGKDAQTDAQLRTYFVQFINSRSEATRAALAFAIQSLSDGVKFDLIENIDYTTQTQRLGYFYAVVDNGSGGIPLSPFLTVVQNALEVVRGFTIMFEVQPVILTTVNISVTVNIPAQFSLSDPNANAQLITDINEALSTYINLIPIGVGNDIYYSRIYQIIYNVIQNDAPAYIFETSLTSLLLNTGTADLLGDSKHEFTPGTIAISIVNF